MQQVIGEKQNRVIVVPLGRGPIGYYSDISERDVLDVMADVKAHYEIDEDRIFSGGYSMGGYGAYRMAMAYPHRFAGAISWVGFTGDCFNGTALKSDRECKSGAIGNVINYVKNLLHVPTAMLYSGADELVHTHSHQAMARRFRNSEPPYIYYLHPAADHFTFALADDWSKEAEWTSEYRRVSNPGRVVFRTMRWLWAPTYGIKHDRAYWVSGLRPRDASRFIDVDVTSKGCGPVIMSEQEGSAAGPDPVPWQAEWRTVGGGKATAASALLKGKLRNVRKMRVDVQDTCLAVKRVKYQFESDGATTLRLSDGRVLKLDKGKSKGTI